MLSHCRSLAVRAARLQRVCDPTLRAVTQQWARSAASAAGSGAAPPRSATPASSGATSAAAAAKPRASTADLYRSPLRDADDRTYDHLWQDMWTLDAPGQRFTIIWLGGLGQGRENVATMASILAPPRTKFVVPQSPRMSITALPDAPDQRCWFDLLEERRDAAREAQGDVQEEDEIGIEDMTKRVHELIEHEMKAASLPSSRVLLAGFGEGGALALHAALCFPGGPLAGAASLAGYLPLPHLYPQHVAACQAHLPLLAVHGQSDFTVPWAWAKQRYNTLLKAAAPGSSSAAVPKIELRTEWSMGHFLSNNALMSTQAWMQDTLEKAAASEKRIQ